MMNTILQDLSTPNLIRAIENNHLSMLDTFRRWPRMEVHDKGTLKWCISDIPFPFFNSIFYAQLEPSQIDGTIQFLIEEARSRGVPLMWWTGPSTKPPDLVSHLERYGFKGDESSLGMAVVLANLEGPPMPPGFTFRQVSDDAAIKLSCQVFVAGFELPDFVAEACYDLLHYVEVDSVRAYLGYLDGKPVATSLLILGAGVAGMYNVTTIPEARRRGIGAVMTALPLLEAKAMGYRAGILSASEMGAGVYRSLGFQEYYKVGQYIWSP